MLRQYKIRANHLTRNLYNVNPKSKISLFPRRIVNSITVVFGITYMLLMHFAY